MAEASDANDTTQEAYYHDIESKWASEYPSIQSEKEHWDFYKECGYKDPEKTINSILDNVVWTEKKTVLDFGCDTGIMLNFICKGREGIVGHGIDINSAAIAAARETFPQYQFKTFGGLRLPYEDKSFDLVFVCAVIKHIRYEDRSIVYNELKRVSKQVLFIDADCKETEEVKHGSWTFYNSHFESEFAEFFKPITVLHECGDLLGLYEC